LTTPEARARQNIDAQLAASGWLVQDRAAMNLYAGRGVAVREFPLATGYADYLLFVDRKAVGVVEVKAEGIPLSSVAVLRGKPDILENRFLAFFPNSEHGRQRMLSMISGVAITRLALTKLNSAQIPLPPLPIQQAIVAEIEAEQGLVAANRELISRFEKKIQATLARVWGEDNPVQAEG